MSLPEYLKVAQLLGAVLATGAPFFLLFIWQPALVQAGTAATSHPASAVAALRMKALAAGGALLVAGAALADLFRLAQNFSQTPFYDSETLSLAWLLAAETDTGRLLALRPILALLVAATAVRRYRWATMQRWMVSLPAAGVLATFSFGGHAAAISGVCWPIAVDLVHMAATAVWYGGLVSLALLPWRSLLSLTDPLRPVLVRSISRFSNAGLLTMLTLAVTGGAMSLLRLYGPAAMVEHPYGQMLRLKLTFLVGVLALAAANLWLTRRHANLNPIRWLVRAEAVVGLLVLGAAGVLSTTAPPLGEPVRLAVTIQNNQVTPAQLDLPLGKPVLLRVTNQQSTSQSYLVAALPHEMIGEGEHNHGAAADMRILVEAGKTETVQFVPRRAGTYSVYVAGIDSMDPNPKGTVVVPRE